MAINKGREGGDFIKPTHYWVIDKNAPGKFTLGHGPKGESHEDVTSISGELIGFSWSAHQYKTGRYAGQSVVEAHVRLQDGAEIYDLTVSASSVTGTCLAAYADAMEKGEDYCLGLIQDDRDPQVTKVFVKAGMTIYDPRVTARSRTGLATKELRLAYTIEAMERAKARGCWFEPYHGSTKEGDGSPEQGPSEVEPGFEEAAAVFFRLTGHALNSMVLMDQGLRSGLERILAGALGLREGGPRIESTDPHQALGGDHWRALARGLANIEAGKWGMPKAFAGLKASLDRSNGGVADEFDPFAEGNE